MVLLMGAPLLLPWLAAQDVAPLLQVSQHKAVHNVLMGFPEQLLKQPQGSEADLQGQNQGSVVGPVFKTPLKSIHH